MLLSVDDAFPLVAFGGAAPLATQRMLRIGDASGAGRTSPKALSLDVAVAERLTVGGKLLLQVGFDSSILGGELRVGYVLPLGPRLSLWPRLGVAHETSLAGGWAQVTRTDGVVEARLVWSVTRSWAITVGPSVALAVHSTRTQAAASGGPPYGAFGGQSLGYTVYPENAPARVSVAAGLTGHLDDVGDEGPAAPARIFLGVARALPLLRYRVDTAVAGKGRAERGLDGPPGRADSGTVDATSIVPQVPVLSVDVALGRHLTVGTAGSIGVVRFTDLSTQLIPASSARSTVAWTISPRLGWRAELSRSFAVWPRAGLTYVNASSDRTSAYHLGVDADAFAVVSPVRGVGLLFGPSLELPVTGARTVENGGSSQRREQSVVSVALTGGLVVEIP